MTTPTLPALPSVPRLLLAIALRVVLVVGVDRFFTFLVDRYDNSPDANIGLGLLGFVVIMGVASVIGGVDGWRLGVAASAIIWTVAGILAGAAMVVTSFVAYPPYDAGLLLDDLREMGPFLAGLVIVPALVCAALGQVSRPLDLTAQHS